MLELQFNESLIKKKKIEKFFKIIQKFDRDLKNYQNLEFNLVIPTVLKKS